MQKVLTMLTQGSDLRDEAVAWNAEDADLVRPGDGVGDTPGPRWSYEYASPLHALGDGWRLLQSPKKCRQMVNGKAVDEWEWWFTHDGDPRGAK